MSLDRLLLAPLAIGHLALFVLVVNVSHAFGHRERTMSLIKLSLLLTYMTGSAVLAWEAWSGPVLAWSWPSLIYALVCILTGVIVFPTLTAYLHHRPRPEDIEEHATEVDLAAELGRETLIGTGDYCRLLRLPGNESFRLRKIECAVPMPGLPLALDGLTVLHISDLHLAPCFTRRFFEAVADEAGSMPADLVLFTGDLVDHDSAVEWVGPIFSRLRGKHGSFAILGNHDLDHHPDRLLRTLAEAGFADLQGKWTVASLAGSTLALGGTSYPWGPPLVMAERPEADFSIVLSHVPDLYYELAKSGIDLMLSGHNHGGQVRLPLVGPVFMPSRYSRRFDRGFFRRDGLTLHVSQGVAGKHPIRYGCVPEITRLTLNAVSRDRRADQAEATGRRSTQDFSLATDPIR